jgi:carboxymethylenebutenolidase
MNARILGGVTALGIALASCSPKRSPLTTARGQGSGPVVAITPAPLAVEVQGIQWVKVTAPGLGVMLAAVARPLGAGPFPAVIVLHGTHGFAREYVRLAQDIARNGLFAVAACWFSGSSGAGSRFVNPIECPEAPALTLASSPTAMRTVDALVEAVRTLPGVDAHRVALFGHSRGGGAALQYVRGGAAVQAVVLNSTGYPPELSDRASEIRVPVLILHGTADSPSEGGSAFTDVRMARRFEAALRAAGKTVEATYYQGNHNSIFSSASQYDAEVQRIVEFLRRHLVN